MNAVLHVHLHGGLAGRLVQDGNGQVSFAYDAAWLAAPGASALSHSLPLKAEPFSRSECEAFFAGLLPEQGQRDQVARALGVSAGNVFSLLREIGRECSGAVSLVPEGEPSPVDGNPYVEIGTRELAAAFSALPARPLLAGDREVRLSLAGVQAKLVVRIADGVIFLPRHGALSTHILKPTSPLYPDIVQNEAFCMRLAAASGLNVARVSVGKAEGTEYLSIERYDRFSSPAGLGRRHQEDFCQALNRLPDRKYQVEGGPTLKQSFGLMRDVSSAAVLDLHALLDAVIFNCLIGNNDAHGKNFSILYAQGDDGATLARLAPLYDLICTVKYEGLSKDMAMKLGGESDSGRLAPRHFDAFATEAGLAKPQVRARVVSLSNRVLGEIDNVLADLPGAVSVAAVVRPRCERMRLLFNK
jgi:serine/threonine-protein kinase HipA